MLFLLCSHMFWKGPRNLQGMELVNISWVQRSPEALGAPGKARGNPSLLDERFYKMLPKGVCYHLFIKTMVSESPSF